MAIELATNALITLEDFQAFMADDSDTALNKDELHFHINQASQAIVNYLDRLVAPAQDVTEVFDGDDSKDYYVRYIRINAEPTLSFWNGSDWTEMAIASYYWTYNATTGRIYFERGRQFCEGSDNYRIIYTTGYSVADVPAPIKQACCQLVQRGKLKADAGKEGMRSEAVGEVSNSYDLPDWPPDVLRLLQTYRHISVGG